MKRRNFLEIVTGAGLAVVLGAKAKAKTPVEPSRELTKKYIEYCSGFQALEIAGVPVYCDPYFEEGKIRLFKRENMAIAGPETWGKLSERLWPTGS